VSVVNERVMAGPVERGRGLSVLAYIYQARDAVIQMCGVLHGNGCLIKLQYLSYDAQETVWKQLLKQIQNVYLSTPARL